MSDTFEMLVDTEVSSIGAGALSDRVIDRLRCLGLIVGEATRECVLVRTGYRPGPAVSGLYMLPEHETAFWKLLTCGVEFEVGNVWNLFALAEVNEAFGCPKCKKVPEPWGDEFKVAFGNAIAMWQENGAPSVLKCPICDVGFSISEWHSEPPLGFGHLAFRFWNWPPLKSPVWKIDLIREVREVTGHRIVHTWGRI